MQPQITTQTKVLITAVVTLFIFSVLLWEYYHGGVQSHHILDQKELPAISNWWGGLLLPVLTWILLGRIEKRLHNKALSQTPIKSQKFRAPVLFAIGFIFAILIAVSFVNGYHFFLANIPYIFLIISLVVPIYYSEFILGFVLSMTVTFGAVLPTLFILVFAVPGFLIYRFIRPLFIRLLSILRKNPG